MSLSEYKNLISTLATIVTILQFLSGIEICQKVIKQGATGDISGFPFVSGAFASSAWFMFSYIVFDYPMMITNTVGLSLQIIYLFIYIKYCVSIGPWKTLRKQIMIFSLLSGALAYYTFFTGLDQKILRSHVGTLCCIGSIIFSAAPLISLRDVFRMKSTEILPFPLILSMFFVGLLWSTYGIIIENNFVAYPNMIVCLISLFQLSLFLIFPSKTSTEKELLL